MAKIEQTLEQLFDNNFDCYTTYYKSTNQSGEEEAMTKKTFVKIVGDLLTEKEANKANDNLK